MYTSASLSSPLLRLNLRRTARLGHRAVGWRRHVNNLLNTVGGVMVSSWSQCLPP